MVTDGIADHLSVLRGAFFVAFFVGVGLAYHFRDRFHFRRAFLGTFFACLVVVNVTSVGLVPLVDLHKFPESGPKEATVYELDVLTEEGNELPLDARAIEPVTLAKESVLAERMIHGCNESERRRAAGYVLGEARDFRQSLESGRFARESVYFPQHTYGFRWTRETLSEYGDLVALRIYERHLSLTADGTSVASATERRIYEFSGPADDSRALSREEHVCS